MDMTLPPLDWQEFLRRRSCARLAGQGRAQPPVAADHRARSRPPFRQRGHPACDRARVADPGVVSRRWWKFAARVRRHGGRHQAAKSRSVGERSRVCQPSTRRMVTDWTPTAPRTAWRRSGTGQQALRLDSPLELLVQVLDRVRGPDRAPLLGRVAHEREQALAGFFQARRDRPAAKLPLGQERLTPDYDLGGGLGVHHVVEVGLDSSCRASARGRAEAPAHGAALNRDIVDRLASAASRPCRRRRSHRVGRAHGWSGRPAWPATRPAFAIDVLDGEHHLLAVAADTREISSEMAVALRSSRTLTMVPSRISGTTSSRQDHAPARPARPSGSSARPWLTTSLPMALEQPGQRRRARRVFMPARKTSAIKALARWETAASGQQVALPFLLASLVAQTSARHESVSRPKVVTSWRGRRPWRRPAQTVLARNADGRASLPAPPPAAPR